MAPTTAAAFGPVGSFDGSGASSGQFNHPQSAVSTGAAVYVADTANNRVPFYSSSGTFQGTLGSPPSAPQDVAASGTLVAAAGPSQVVRWLAGVPLAAISPPGSSYGVAIGSGTVYVSDAQSGVIHKYDATLGSFQGDIGGGQLAQPQGMTTDGSGSLYVADTGNGRIVKLDPSSGAVQQAWPMPSYTIVANGQTITGRIEPHDVAVDASGRVLAPDAGTHSNLVAVFGADGSVQQIFGSPDSDPGNPCALRGPWGLAVTGSALYVVSTGENRIRIFDDTAASCPAVNFGPGGVGPGGGPAGIAADRRRPKIKLSGFPKGRCTRRNFAFVIHASDDVLLSRLTLFVNRRRVARQTINKPDWILRVRIPAHKISRQIPRASSARVLITVQVKDASGKKASLTRAFSICGAG